MLASTITVTYLQLTESSHCANAHYYTGLSRQLHVIAGHTSEPWSEANINRPVEFLLGCLSRNCCTSCCPVHPQSSPATAGGLHRFGVAIKAVIFSTEAVGPRQASQDHVWEETEVRGGHHMTCMLAGRCAASHN